MDESIKDSQKVQSFPATENEDRIEGNDEDVDMNENEDDLDDARRLFTDSPSKPRSTILDGRRDATLSPVKNPTQEAAQLSHERNGLSNPGPNAQSNPALLLTSPTPHPSTPKLAAAPVQEPRRKVREEALSAAVYDIAPTIAAPHSTSINAITATPDLRWVFSGGADGYIRKFNWVDTANGKTLLTVAQRHPFVDSVTKAGVLMSYWENEEPQVKSPPLQPNDDNTSLSPVYSLAVHSEALWLLSGLDSGGINLQSVRHDEGKRIACLRKHTSAVSVLTLAEDEKSVLSGSWDKNIYDWDLNTGQVKREFSGSGGQISALELRPFSSLDVPPETVEATNINGTLSSNNADEPKANGVASNGDSGGNPPTSAVPEADGNDDVPASPSDSLFGGDGADSLFGDDNDTSGAAAPSAGNFGDDEDDEFSRAIANGMKQQESADADGDVQMANGQEDRVAAATSSASASASAVKDEPKDEPPQTGPPSNSPSTVPVPVSNGLLGRASEETARPAVNSQSGPATSDSSRHAQCSDTTFLAASFDGTLRVWDRRQPNPVATILPRNMPPWCMNACWSPDGNHMYAGRRNGTVEEYSLHKSLRESQRVFRFPQGSGPVSTIKAMPNGRHLVCASFDILRLYDLKEQQAFKHATVPFLIIPGHRGGVISSLYIDPTCNYLISTAGNRGWEGTTTEVMLGYEIGVPR
ncbi:MAG: hypothetical protein M1825_002030 [Sarcosagium campestre]|nr:MAG: hypothetical protein M1825_002030 [Sarcosagium campestre]